LPVDPSTKSCDSREAILSIDNPVNLFPVEAFASPSGASAVYLRKSIGSSCTTCCATAGDGGLVMYKVDVADAAVTSLPIQFRRDVR